MVDVGMRRSPLYPSGISAVLWALMARPVPALVPEGARASLSCRTEHRKVHKCS